MALRFSTAFDDTEEIGGTYTCDGDNAPLPIGIDEAPDGTMAFALYFEDPDAPDGTFLHWMVYNIPKSGDVNEGDERVNDFGTRGYGGPCPPLGEGHRYVLTLYALNALVDGEPPRLSQEFEETFDRYIIESTSREGTYSRASQHSRTA